MYIPTVNKKKKLKQIKTSREHYFYLFLNKHKKISRNTAIKWAKNQGKAGDVFLQLARIFEIGKTCGTKASPSEGSKRSGPCLQCPHSFCAVAQGQFLCSLTSSANRTSKVKQQREQEIIASIKKKKKTGHLDNLGT